MPFSERDHNVIENAHTRMNIEQGRRQKNFQEEGLTGKKDRKIAKTEK